MITSAVVICDRADPYDLFAAARRVAGNPPRWREHDFGDVRMLWTVAGQGAEAQAGVHFPAAGGLCRAEGIPRGYAAVTFANPGFGSQRGRHERLVGAFGELLDAGGLSWMWQYEDGPWQAGPRLRGGRRTPSRAGRTAMIRAARAAAGRPLSVSRAGLDPAAAGRRGR